MKKLSFLMLAAAGVMFNACSDETVSEGGGGKGGEALSEGYMALSINLPTTSSTKAENDQFDDGLPKEYEVNDCALLLFQGENEASAKLINAQVIMLPTASMSGSTTDNITSIYKATATVEGYEGKTVNGKTNNLYALAVLNYKNVMSIGASNMPSFGDQAMTATTTLADIRKLQTSANLISRGGDSYFFMTNAVLCEDEGGSVSTAPRPTSVFQLAQMDPDKIKQTKAEAEKPENLAGNIFVERAVAKATLSLGQSVTKVKTGVQIPQDGSDTENVLVDETLEIDPQATEWAIDNMEETTYIARNPGMESSDNKSVEKDQPYIAYTSQYFTINGGNGNYRFVSGDALENATLSGDAAYRTYWCIDPHYNVDNNGDDDFMKAATSFVKAGTNNPLYCNENTFDVARQSHMNTTRAIVKVVLKEASAEGTPVTEFWTVSNVAGRFTKLEDAATYVLDDVISNTDVVECFNEYYQGEETEYHIQKTDFKVTFAQARNEDTGQLFVENIELSDDFTDDGSKVKDFKDGFKDAFAKIVSNEDSEEEDVLSTVNSRVIVSQYENGVMYYEARFKHFAGDPYGETGLPGKDDLAPWNVTGATWETTPAGGSTAAAYHWDSDAEGEPKSAKNYLGRYGMVRNNWYDVTVTAFNSLGLPVDPSGKITKGDNPGTPDDDINEYMSVKINVLSWAKRGQSWSF